MANGLTLQNDPTDDAKISLSFEKENFTDFLGSLLSSPREETKTFFCGYDVVPADIGALCDKIDHFVRTQNDKLFLEFSSRIVLEDDSDIFSKNSQNFMNVDYSGRVDPTLFEVTMTFLIGFNRLEDEKKYERQVVSIIFSDSSPGRVQVRIRSTELTWPSAIFGLFESELRGLCHRTAGKGSFSEGSGSTGLRPREIQSDRRELDETLQRYGFRSLKSLLFPFAFLMPMMATILVVEARREDTWIYDPDTNTVAVSNFPDTVDELGWERAAELTILSKEMVKSGYASYLPGEGPIARLLYSVPDLFSPIVVMICLAAFAFAVYIARRSELRNCVSRGRLFWERSAVTKRPSLSPSTGVLVGILLAIFANVSTNALIFLLNAG